ncbi:polysaccharide biosynthesis protein [Kiloniella sp. b19]|uniref:polysaccharide biosynthesis protein n=1 Tax=Kiloniella sp. GXU_MW_B19 TaxID=3141326 RepID=UPI0031DA5C4B
MQHLPLLPKGKALIAFAHDIIMLAVSFALALSLRLGIEDAATLYFSGKLDVALSLFTAMGILIFWLAGLYRGIWRYASMADLATILKSVSLLLVLYVPALFLVNRLEDIPRSTVLINWFVLIFLLGGPRLLFRLYKDGLLKRSFSLSSVSNPGHPIVLVGATDQSEAFIRAMSRNAKAPYNVLALIDFNPRRAGRKLHGLTVQHIEPEAIGTALSDYFPAPRKLVLSRLEDRETMQHLREQTSKLGIKLERLPKESTLDSGNESNLKVQPIAIEDLLGRQQVQLDRAAIREMIQDKTVLITGAGGSIGSELVRQIASMLPRKLVLVDNGEYNLYAIDMELHQARNEVPRESLLCDVRDRAKIQDIFTRQRPDVVFHAAAFKHVPMVEANPLEGLNTNVVGTRNVADACRDHKVKAMVLISTDKAINPPNIMGASKRLAEIYCQSRDIESRNNEQGTRFVTVRFGNVLGSTGSVVPLFKKQLEEGGPLTVTHPDITRYFMSIREAVELVLQSATMGLTDLTESLGRIYVLNMGEPVRIVDLAREVIRLGGFVPDEEIQIEFTGLRPGEKLYEELFHDEEPLEPTHHDSLQLASPRVIDAKLVAQKLDQIKKAIDQQNTDDAIAILMELVPEYCGHHRQALPDRDPAQKEAQKKQIIH